MNPIEEVKARLDIVEVIGQSVQLQKAGRNFKALCPFHPERTPSFIVSPERQTWHCFGACASGGDIFSFVMKKKGLQFGQALRLLAERAGVLLPERREEVDQERERLRGANEAAAQYFHHLLLNSEAGRPAREYIERRGVDAKAAREFCLGYAPSGWDALHQYLAERGWRDQELLAAGLLVEGESGLYDRFRGRLMFPIWDVKGRAIGFGARALDDSLPKYLNTPQTALFDKGGTLYALDRAYDAIRREGAAVIVEGYMDAIAAHQHGFANVVASMGTALTERQLRLLKRYTRNIVLALDADAAGSEAALHGQQVAQQASEGETVPVLTWRGLVRHQEAVAVDLRVAVLPQGRDPDEVIRQDAAAWQALIAAAKPVLDYKFETVMTGAEAANPRARSQAVQDLLPLVGTISDPVVRAHYLQRLSRLALVKEEELAAMLRGRTGLKPGVPVRAAGTSESAGGSTNVSPMGRGDQREEFLLALLLRYPSLREWGLTLDANLFWQTENQEVLAAWRQTQAVEGLREVLSPELQQHLERLLAQRLPGEEQAEAALKDCLTKLKERRLQLEKQASVAALAALEAEVGPAAVAEAAMGLWRGEQVLPIADERVLQAADRGLQDLEAGLRLHSPNLRAETEKRKEGISAEDAEVKNA